MFSDNEPSQSSAHLSFSVINVKEDSFLMVRITHIPRKFLQRNNLHLLSSVCLCGLFRCGVIYCSTVSLALISRSSAWNVIFFFLMAMSENWQWCNAPLIRGCACLTRVNFWAGSGRYCASWVTAEPQSAGLGQAPGLRAGPRAALAARVHIDAPNTRYCVPGTSWLLLYHLNKPELVCNVLLTKL